MLSILSQKMEVRDVTESLVICTVDCEISVALSAV